MTIDTIEQLLVQELKDIYDAEKQLVKALPKMAKAAKSPDLKEAFQSHLEETKGHVERLNEVFASLGVKAGSKPCAGMKGLVEEGKEMIDEDASDDIRDAGLIGAAQRVEHYEMAAYGTVRALAEELGHDDVVTLLQQTLDEEKAADEKLTEVSMSILEGIGGEAEEADEEEPPAKQTSRGKTRTAGGSNRG